MAFHHKFLATKSWNVHSLRNQQAVAEAEALQATLQRRVEERKRTLDRERSRQESLASIAKAQGTRGSDAAASGVGSSVAFLYEPPPGFVPAPPPPRVQQEDEVAELHDLTKSEDVKPAVAAAAAAAPSLPMNAPPLLVPGADGTLVPESHEDRRARHRGMSAQAVREELHPALRGAPVTAPHVRQGTFTAKLLGVLLRDTRCMRCGGVGHSSTDRECPRFNDPTVQTDQSRLVREDPLTKIQATAAAAAPALSGFLPASTAAAAQFGAPSGTGSGVAGGKQGQFRLIYNDESYTAGGFDPGHPLQQVLLDPVEGEEEIEPVRRRQQRGGVKSECHGQASAAAAASSSSSGALSSSPSSLSAEEVAFYSSLPPEDMRLLLKQLKRSRGGDSGGDRKKKKRKREKRHRREKKEKKKRHRSRSSSDSSSSSSSSSDDSDSDSSSGSRDNHKRRHRHDRRSRSHSRRDRSRSRSRRERSSSRSAPRHAVRALPTPATLPPAVPAVAPMSRPPLPPLLPALAPVTSTVAAPALASAATSALDDSPPPLE